MTALIILMSWDALLAIGFLIACVLVIVAYICIKPLHPYTPLGWVAFVLLSLYLTPLVAAPICWIVKAVEFVFVKIFDGKTPFYDPFSHW